MNLEKAVRRKVTEYNELIITREMLIELVRAQRIGVSNDPSIVFDKNNPEKFIRMVWERSTNDE